VGAETLTTAVPAADTGMGILTLVTKTIAMNKYSISCLILVVFIVVS
jgi:hypothetical protein